MVVQDFGFLNNTDIVKRDLIQYEAIYLYWWKSTVLNVINGIIRSLHIGQDVVDKSVELQIKFKVMTKQIPQRDEMNLI